MPLEHFLYDPSSFHSNRQKATVLFDDGYKDNIEYAVPILQEYNCPASFYMVTDCINRNVPTWTYIIDYIFQHTTSLKIELDIDFVPEKFKRLTFKKGDAMNHELVNFKPWLKKLPNQHRILITETCLQQCSDIHVPSNKMMSWKNICEMRDGGFIIGSHSHTHPLLASIENETEISSELNISAKIIEEKTGCRPITISYPVGSVDERVMKLSKEAGYQYGLAVDQKFYRPGIDSNFRIPRVELYQESRIKQKLRISGIYSFIKKLGQ